MRSKSILILVVLLLLIVILGLWLYQSQKSKNNDYPLDMKKLTTKLYDRKGETFKVGCKPTQTLREKK